MKIRLDPDSPIPLYHQIAEAIRYRIATGRLSPGDRLTPVREAARELSVNLHTVRRAYTELAAEGVIESRGSRGTTVRARSALRSGPPRAGSLEEFLAKTRERAQQRYGLLPFQLARLLEEGPVDAAPARVHVIECSETQCLDHVREIEERFLIQAEAWPLSRSTAGVGSSTSEPPAGPVIATYFHYNEIRRLWPSRLAEIHFLAIHPDPALARSEQLRGVPGRRASVPVCEFDQARAQNIAADLSQVFAQESFEIVPRVVSRAGELLADRRHQGSILFAPRVWAELSAEQQDDQRAIKVRYVIQAGELDQLERVFGWRRRAEAGCA